MRTYFKDMKNLAEFMRKMSETGTVMAVFHYNDACKLLTEIMGLHPDFSVISIELHDGDYDNYYDEYYITLSDFDGGLYVEPGKRGDIFLGFDADLLILSPDASSAVVKKNSISGTTLEAVFENDEELTCDDCDLCACTGDDCCVSCDDFADEEDDEEEAEDQNDTEADDDEIELTIRADGEETRYMLPPDAFIDFLTELLDF